MKKISIALIGCGYWGEKILHTILKHNNFDLKYCCDTKNNTLKNLKKLLEKNSRINFINNINIIFNDKNIDAVFIATPLITHFQLVKKSLEAKKHVLVEKPITTNILEAKKLLLLSKKVNKLCMVDHIFLYDDAIIEIKKLINNKNFGIFKTFLSSRENYGPFRKGESVLWDLGIHDIYIARYFFDKEPKKTYLQSIRKAAQFQFSFSNKQNAFTSVNWLNPDKKRQFVCIGSKQVLKYTNTYPDIIFSYQKKENKIFLGEKLKINRKETLINLLNHFADCINNNKKPRTDISEGIQIIKILNHLENYEKQTKH